MAEPKEISYTSASKLLNSIFEGELANPDKYDQEIVQLIKNHLNKSPIPSKAGIILAKDLIQLAQHRIEEGRK